MRKKYEYDVCMEYGKDKKKYLEKKIKGSVIKNFKVPIHEIKPNQKVVIYKTTIDGSKEKVKPHRSFSLENIIHDAVMVNFYYYCICDVQYKMSYDCEANLCDGICRCGTMECVHILQEDIDQNCTIDTIINNIFDKVGSKFLLKMNEIDILKYCIERLLRSYRLEETSSYYIDYGASYYGDEINGIYLEDANEIANKVSEMFFLSPIELIKQSLENEYGYLTERMKEIKKCYVKEINSNNLIISNKEHYKKLNTNTIEMYKKYSYPIGVYLKEKDIHKTIKYRIIDGYHRYSALFKPNTIQKIIAVE